PRSVYWMLLSVEARCLHLPFCFSRSSVQPLSSSLESKPGESSALITTTRRCRRSSSGYFQSSCHSDGLLFLTSPLLPLAHCYERTHLRYHVPYSLPGCCLLTTWVQIPTRSIGSYGVTFTADLAT